MNLVAKWVVHIWAMRLPHMKSVLDHAILNAVVSTPTTKGLPCHPYYDMSLKDMVHGLFLGSFSVMGS